MPKNVLITGAAKRIGAACARRLHKEGCNIILHYLSSQAEAVQLSNELNQIRAKSAVLVQADLQQMCEVKRLALQAEQAWGGVDVLINNASSFYPQALTAVTEADWDQILASNLKAPFFLCQALAEILQAKNGCIVNIVDIHAERGLPGYPVYSLSKAGLMAMTKILAKELAPAIRVNGVAPGAILWPEQAIAQQAKADIVNRIPLGRIGHLDDITNAVLFLIKDADYITGQIITVDGGRLLFS
jgi:pteridine reductase